MCQLKCRFPQIMKSLAKSPLVAEQCDVNINLLKRYDSTLNSHRATRPFVSWEEEEARWETPDYCEGIFPQNWGEIELNPFPPVWFLKIWLTIGINVVPLSG
ncbi:hypothetical protein TNCV_3209681 [Trichonephila clavipes]|nr:hypothetical protein TNCV_3209681 [Trichonephila clavipes]